MAIEPQRTTIINVERWPDTQGQHINAHGGGVLFYDGAYYLFGEHKVAGKAGNVAHVGVSCYRSTDLMNWTNEGVALAVSQDPASDIVEGCVIERPKVIYNATTGKFVMWFHLELKDQGYKTARAGVAVADKVTGPYKFLRSFRCNPGVAPKFGGDDKLKHLWQRDLEGGQMSRDMTLFVDDDGTAYHITSAEDNTTLHVHELSKDYLGYSGVWARVLAGQSNEAPALVKHGGKYWMISSGCTGWPPNAARSAVADHPFGPWTPLGNPAKGYNPILDFDQNKTFGAQSTCIIPIQGKKDAFIAMFDVWRPSNQEDSRYIWLPIRWLDNRFEVAWTPRFDLSWFDHMPPREPTITLTATKEGGSLSLAAPEPGVTLRYTTDGSVPTATSTAWTVPVAVRAGTRVMAVAEKEGRCSTPVLQDFPMDIQEVPQPEVFLDGLKPIASVQPRPIKIGKSVYNNPLRGGGKEYAHGIGVHAVSSLTYALDPKWTRFVAKAALDDDTTGRGDPSIIAAVRIDGAVVAVTPLLTKKKSLAGLDVAIPAGAKSITLDMEHGRDGIDGDHADWLDAGFRCDPR